MKILVDADACPVKREILNAASARGIEVVLVVNIHHQMSQYDEATIVVVGDYEDEVDFRIVELMQARDLVVTQDIGLAAMVLGGGAQAISPRGEVFLDHKMPRMLALRHQAKQAMLRNKYPKKQKAFSAQDRKRFVKALLNILDSAEQINDTGSAE